MDSAEFIGRMFAKLIRGDLDQYAKKHPQGFGHIGNRARVTAVAEYCAQTWPGDLVEIGVLHGATTKFLAQVASKYNRRVIAVDPFDVKKPKYGDYYQIFLKSVEPWGDIIDVVKLSSMDPVAVQYVKGRSLCFAYVDGLHTYEACYSDILTVGHCNGIIAVDDIHVGYGFAEVLRHAFWDSAIVLGRIPLDNSLSREGYLIQGNTQS